MSSSADLGRHCSATEVKYSYAVLMLRQATQYHAWMKKRGKRQGEETLPYPGTERKVSTEYVGLVLVLMRLEGYTHAPMQQGSPLQKASHVAGVSPLKQENYWLLILLITPFFLCDIAACLPAPWFCCQRIISKLGASDTQIHWEFYVALRGFLLVLL